MNGEDHYDKVRGVVSAVDYLTVTTRDDSRGMILLSTYHQQCKCDPVEQKLQKEWRGYGYTGMFIKRLRWGYSEDKGYILIAQGERAQEIWPAVKPANINVTRIDLQTTVRLEKPMRKLVKKYWKDIRQADDTPITVGRKWKNLAGGATIEIGSMHSSQYGVVYDKGAQLGTEDPGTMWRYEVRLTKPLSLPMFQSLYGRYADSPGDPAHTLAIKGYVHQWFSTRGVSPIFNPGKDDIAFEIQTRTTTEEKKLTWLHTQVRPTVLQLIAAGSGHKVHKALGLDIVGPVMTNRGGDEYMD